MNLGQLRSLFRSMAGDTAVPYLWSDAEIALFATQAEQEAVERARLLYDESVTVDLLPGETSYALPGNTLYVHRAWTATRQPVDIVSHDNLPLTSSTGRPRFAAEGESNTLTVWPAPREAETLHLAVYALPAGPLENDADEPEIADRHHFRLLDWMLRCAYLKQDADTYSEEKAMRHEAAFERSFGFRADANVRRKQRARGVTLVKPNW